MIDIAWLETLALKTDFEYDDRQILEKQKAEIQEAYASNNQYALKTLLSKKNQKFANKNVVFTLSV